MVLLEGESHVYLVVMLDNPIVLSLLVSLAIQLFFFGFAATLKTDKVTDLSYGLTFIILAVFWLYYDNQPATNYRVLLTLMVIVWGVRIAGYLLIRILKTGRDARFDAMRDNPLKFGRFWLLQGVSVWLIMLPVVYVLTRQEVLTDPDLVAHAGFGIWAIGLLIETVADYQLYRFRFHTPKTAKKHDWITNGLWRYSRHPNYLGEIMVWWGVFLYGLSTYEELGWLTVVGPVTITVLIRFVSGIPLLEKRADQRWGADSAYKAYKHSAGLLIPTFWRSNAAK